MITVDFKRTLNASLTEKNKPVLAQWLAMPGWGQRLGDLPHVTPSSPAHEQ